MPKVKDGPKELNAILESTFAGCISNGGTESKCSAAAWANAERAGWHKDREGKWVKKVVSFKRILRIVERDGANG